MPWRLIQFIVVFVIFLCFIGLNLENKCDIKFGTDKMVLKDVPVYFTVFCSFIIGMLCALPFVLGLRFRKKTDSAQGSGLLRKIAERKDTKTKSPRDIRSPKESTQHEVGESNLSNKDFGID